MTTFNELRIPERVAAGAAWLDIHVPTWVDDIDLERLNLGEPCDCVLGQIVGSVEDSDWPHPHPADEPDFNYYSVVADSQWPLKDVLVERLGILNTLTRQEAINLGFHRGVTQEGHPAFVGGGLRLQRWMEWAELTAEWHRVIIERRTAGD